MAKFKSDLTLFASLLVRSTITTLLSSITYSPPVKEYDSVSSSRLEVLLNVICVKSSETLILTVSENDSVNLFASMSRI